MVTESSPGCKNFSVTKLLFAEEFVEKLKGETASHVKLDFNVFTYSSNSSSVVMISNYDL